MHQNGGAKSLKAPWSFFDDRMLSEGQACSFPSLLIVNPSHVEGKLLLLGNLSFFKKMGLCSSITKQRRRESCFTTSVRLGNTLNMVTFKDEGLSHLLLTYFDKGGNLPALYSLDDLFFRAAKNMNIIQHFWLFIVRQEKNHTYTLCCYQGDAFLFKRCLPKTMILRDEINVSKVYMKRFGYATQTLQILLFSNDASIVLEEGKRGVASFLCKRLPFDLNQVVGIGLKSKPLPFFLPLTRPFTGAILLTCIRRISVRGVMPVGIMVGVLFLSVPFMYTPQELVDLKVLLHKEEKLPDNYDHFRRLEHKSVTFYRFENDPLLGGGSQKDDSFSKALRTSLGNSIRPDMIEYNLEEKRVKLGFKEALKASTLAALKKAFPYYTLTLTPTAVTFVPLLPQTNENKSVVFQKHDALISKEKVGVS
ncbi:MAG: hypothetical protein K2X98_05190 [Alphaproteobacteria bacterium]|nr:hypothetical protein [Alphaproteobacteria bacterium]